MSTPIARAAILALAGLLVRCTAETARISDRYCAANLLSGADGNDELRIFPSDGKIVTKTLPSQFGRVVFGQDGQTIYRVNSRELRSRLPGGPGLSKLELNPLRFTPMPQTTGFAINTFAISRNQDKLLISGNRFDGNVTVCGLFDVSLASGLVREVLRSNCHGSWGWEDISFSPDGEHAIAVARSRNSPHRDLEMIDLVHGTAKAFLAHFEIAAWSPDGRWIAAIGNHHLSVMEGHNVSKRRDMGRAWMMPEWSPDSRYLLLWQHPLRCGIGIDVDPPATLAALDMQSGETYTIRSSQCRLVQGVTGWVSSELLK